MNKPPSKRGRSAAKSTGKPGTPKHPAGDKPSAAGRGGGRPTGKKKPGWMPDAPARGAPRPPLGPLHQDGSATVPTSDPHAAREAARYEQPIASREMILQLLVASDGPLDAEALATRLALTEPDRFDAMTARLRAMVRDGQLLQNRRGGFVPAQQLDLVAGSVIANPDGFGFLRPEAGGDDMFLPPNEMRKVMHGDRVLASLTNVDRRGRQEGVIVEVLERRVTRMIGRFIVDDGICYVEPDDRRIQRNILIPPEARGDAQPGNLVVCELTRAPDARRPPMGRILTVLGDKLTASLAVQAAIHGHDIPHEFAPEVLDEAAAIPVEVLAQEAAQRVDLRAFPLVTIDGEDAKDFDDA
ncbi:MAG: ribonuclease R, partial [Lysobacter sp.]